MSMQWIIDSATAGKFLETSRYAIEDDRILPFDPREGICRTRSIPRNILSASAFVLGESEYRYVMVLEMTC